MSIAARALPLAALAGTLWLASAAAGPVYRFEADPNSFSPGLVSVEGLLQLTDQAFAERVVDGFSEDISDFFFSVSDTSGRRPVVRDETCGPPDNFCRVGRFFVSDDGERLLGGPGDIFSFNPDIFATFEGLETIILDAGEFEPRWGGSFGSEARLCGTDPDVPSHFCTFEGEWVLAPEPGTLALLSLALVGLGYLVALGAGRRRCAHV